MQAESTLNIERGARIGQAYEVLRDLIVAGRISPGARIIEQEVAVRLGVSRTPVRAALQRLQSEGYVKAATGAQARMTVAPVTEQDARELFAIVAQVEGLAARWAAERPDVERRDLVVRLRGLNQDLYNAAKQPGSHSMMFELDQALHRGIIEAGAGPRLVALHDSLKPQIERYGRLYMQAQIEEVDESVEEHDALIDAISAGVGDTADAAMRRNWRNTAERLCTVIRNIGERGIW